jgi:hypothetical protein
VTNKSRVVPLINFESTVEEYDFGSGTSIARLTQAEANVLGSPYLIGETSHSNRSRTTFKLQLRYEGRKLNPAKRSLGPHDHGIHQPLFNLVAALRLHKPGDFGVPIYIELEPTQNRELEMGGFWGQAKRLGLTYELKAEDLVPVSKLASAIQKARAKGGNRLDLALLRFGDTYGRNRSEDALVDGQIALESCLTPESMTEVGYRLSLRGAALLTGQGSAAPTRFLLNLMYDARSKLVHRGWSFSDCFGNKEFRKKAERYQEMSGHKLMPENFGDYTLEFVRKILRRVIHSLSDSSSNIDELIEQIDNQIAKALEHVISGSSK